MKFKKSITLLLVLSMFLSALAACGDTETAETTPTETAAETTPAETETTRVPTGLPDSDFEGYAFHIIYEKNQPVSRSGCGRTERGNHQ